MGKQRCPYLQDKGDGSLLNEDDYGFWKARGPTYYVSFSLYDALLTDTGGGNSLNVQGTVQDLNVVGAAGCFLEGIPVFAIGVGLTTCDKACGSRELMAVIQFVSSFARLARDT
ncbi:uncharacterized protein LOC116258414 isoform X2 [Nymphaea colorata]|uniref:uncharacterized protein LOC116258414 isoform X2 n=1 Tax=Nymphaea colorata TaxID=210225 RepID=UPI00129E3333|nr:uncharacterized protein LOC116258414 isoform X2 [Nymphaea colorata]XP_031491416.1 uncharacterized protein LOC116258414 isoform X2 [Nymphaea colorata]